VKENKIFRFNFSPFYRCGANLDDDDDGGAHFVIFSMNSSSPKLEHEKALKLSQRLITHETSRDGNMDYAAVGAGKREKFVRHFDV
jgi:hypothetical protein